MNDHTPTPPEETAPAPVPAAAEAGTALPGVLDGEDHKLDPRAIPAWRIGTAITAGVFSLISFIVVISLIFGGATPGLWSLLPPGIWLGFVLLLGVWAFAWPRLRYRHTFFRVDDDRIEIRRGVVWRSVMQVPRSRVQHTDVNRGPIERSYGIATLVIYTAGTEHASISLSGLTEKDAYAIRDHLIAEGGGGDAV